MADKVEVFRASEVKKHKTEDDCWIVIHNNVYNVTKYLNEHPGGLEILLEHGGADGTQDFEDKGHSEDARKILSTLKIGELHPDDLNKDTLLKADADKNSKCDKFKNLRCTCVLKAALIVATAGVVVGFIVKRYVLK